MLDTLIRSGMVIDGSGAAARRADVGIEGDRIAAVGQLGEAPARRTIDATDLVVAPGFIDVHNHSDGWLLKRPHLLPKTTQGFTTELLMSDGISYAPFNDQTAGQWIVYLRALNGLGLNDYRGWSTLHDYMQLLDGVNVQNAAFQIPYANVRSLACGFGRVVPDDFQMNSIRGEISRGMEAGAVGLSTGMDYIAQWYATTDELVEACKAMAPYGGVYVSHIRYKRGLLPALEEAVEIGRRAGVAVHISHLKARSAEQAEQVLEWIDNVARKEVDFSFDVYPYQPGSTMLNYLLPYEAWDRGPMAAASALAEPHVRARFAAGLPDYRLPLDRIRIAWTASRQHVPHQGKTLEEFIADSGQPADTALANLLIENNLAVLLVFHVGDDRLVHPFLQHDLYMMGSDGIYFDEAHLHPRVYGSAGRLLGPCVRDQRLFSLEDAVRKLTSRAADRFGLAQRGLVREGYFADLVLFDPRTVTDRATYEQPNQSTVGIEHVLVNGTRILEHGQPVELPDPLPGRSLRRAASDRGL